MHDDAITSSKPYDFEIVQDPKKGFGARLKALRERSGLSQERLAERIGAERNTISRMEIGKSWPEFGNLMALAQVLGVSAAHLVGESEAPLPSPPKPTPEQALEVLRQAISRPKLAPASLAESLGAVTLNDAEFQDIALAIKNITGGRVQLELPHKKQKTGD